VNVIEQIRPRVDHLTDERSAALLSAVLREAPPARARRRGMQIAGAVAVLAVAGGGTAYATGLVPDFVVDRFDQVGGGADGWPDPIGEPYLVAEVELSNGDVARVWHAPTTDGLCEARDMTGEVTEPADLGAGCARWGAGGETDPRRGVFWQVSPAGPAVVYGDLAGVVDDVRAVDVRGAGWSASFRVVDGTFAGEVPAQADGDRVTFVYRGVDGAEVARDQRSVVVESE
jgi:hypothetical protein